MQKNWYVVYTRPNYEKKMATCLAKKNIESFCPVNYRKIESIRRIKTIREPLFKSYVFAKMTPAEIPLVKLVTGVKGILYWQNLPAVIKQDEIDAIRDFTSDNRFIVLERAPVDMHDIMRVVDNTSYFMEGNVIAVKHKALKVILPSLGYVMTVTTAGDSFFGKGISSNKRKGISTTS
ncbi:MAG: UpxY family transcription antiterminator [Ginsengibacter sp.]